MLTGPPPKFHETRDILLRYTSRLRLLCSGLEVRGYLGDCWEIPVNGSDTYHSSALPQFLLCSSLPRLPAAVKATAIAADDVDEKARFPSEAIELVKEAKFEATDAAADDPFSLPSGQGTRTKSADRELKTGLIVRLYDDLDDGMAVVLGKLPLGALRRGVRVVNS
jgi:hypothetical protein